MKRASSPIEIDGRSLKKQKSAEQESVSLYNDESNFKIERVKRFDEIPTTKMKKEDSWQKEMKLDSSAIRNDYGSTKKQKSVELEFDESNIKKESAILPDEIPTNQMYLLENTRIYTDAENPVVRPVRPPAIMLKISKNIDAELKLIQENFGELRKKRAGIFIRFFPDTDDMRRDLISFLEENRIKYLGRKTFQVVITGLPWHMRTQLIKEALAEKDLHVDKVFQMTDPCARKHLPLFQVVLQNSSRNQNIFYLTDLLNFKISVERIRRCSSRRRTIKRDVEHAYEKGTDVPKCARFGRIDQELSWHGSTNFREVSINNSGKLETTVVIKTETSDVNETETTEVNKIGQVVSGQEGKKYQKNSESNFEKPETTDTKLYQRSLNNYQELPNNNMNESEPGSHLQDIIYIMQEFRKIFGKFNDPKTFALQLKNANSFEKFEMFSAVFLD